MTKYGIHERMSRAAVEQFGMKGMSQEDLAGMIEEHQTVDSFASQVIAHAARRVVFEKQAMGWQ